MNETQAIIKAFDESQKRGERCALATVVSVEGSAYRRPGARMLVCRNGSSTGMISAGCLESDVIEHALRVIKTNTAKLVEYDTASTSDEMVWSLGLGCNGIVRVLVEPFEPQSNYIAALRRTISSDESFAVATVFHHYSLDAAARLEIGSRLYFSPGEETASDIQDRDLAAMIESDAQELSRDETRVYQWNGQTAKVFIETITPPVPLVVFGAGLDALPIIELARTIGWQTEIFDPQERPASRERFGQADKVTLGRPETVSELVTITPRTLALLMTHNYSHDKEILEFLLASPARYIGVMGPRKRTERMLDELRDDGGIFTFEDEERLYAPVGLDIGANTPAEIALAIIAEMRAVTAMRGGGGNLRSRHAPINDLKTTIQGSAPLEELRIQVA